MRVAVHDEAGEPLGGRPYQLRVGEQLMEGTTTGAGLVEQPIPVATTVAKLVVYETAAKDDGRWTWLLRLGDLRPPESRKGAWQRLSNLGYWGPGAVPDEDAGDRAGGGGGGAADPETGRP